MPAPILKPDELKAYFKELSDFEEPLCGGQAAVYPCTHNGEKIALKLIGCTKDDLFDEEEETSGWSTEFLRAKREIEILKRVESNHVVKLGPIEPVIFTSGKQNIFAFALEWVNGTSLHELSRKNQSTLSHKAIAQLGIQMTEAIQALSEQKILHRDITLKNIMRRESNGTFVLLDMGLSFDFNDSSITADNNIPGTRGFIAPERYEVSRKRKLSFKSDCYSLGVVLYICATGCLPYPITSKIDKEYLKQLERSAKSIREKDANFPEKLEVIIMRLLSAAPHNRFPTLETQLMNFHAALTSIGE